MMLVTVLLFVSAVSIVKSQLFLTDGPSRGFSSIASKGTQVLNCDDCLHNVTLPFIFAFGNRVVSSITVSSNGFITFDTLTLFSCCEQDSPGPVIQANSTQVPHVALFQTALSPVSNVSLFESRMYVCICIDM
jgi:hypothetical protein